MYRSNFDMIYSQINETVRIKISHQDESVVMAEVTIQKGTLLPEHVHLSDHSGYLLQGKLRIYTEGISHDFVKGDSWYIQKNASHCTEALEDSVFYDIYRPDGEDLQNYKFTESGRSQ
ncbi:MAG: cupin domain-containing protein [Prolixibacteraceae bacterium]|jgi:quercetin dioxygenase-like cupin family protein